MEQVKEQLERLLAGDIEFPKAGICSNLNNNSPLVRKYSKSWKYYSGDIHYPVPDPEGKLFGRDMYQVTDNMWEGEYGELRRDLVKHILQEISKPTSITERLTKWFKELIWLVK